MRNIIIIDTKTGTTTCSFPFIFCPALMAGYRLNPLRNRVN